MLHFVVKPHRNQLKEVLEFSFAADVSEPIQCAGESPQKIVYKIIVKNHAWGVRACNVKIEYTVEPAGEVYLCPHTHIDSCKERSSRIVLELPSVGQGYFKGSEKQMEVRACVPRPGTVEDFDVFCAITAHLETRDLDRQDEEAIVLASDMHVRIG